MILFQLPELLSVEINKSLLGKASLASAPLDSSTVAVERQDKEAVSKFYVSSARDRPVFVLENQNSVI